MNLSVKKFWSNRVCVYRRPKGDRIDHVTIKLPLKVKFEWARTWKHCAHDPRKHWQSWWSVAFSLVWRPVQRGACPRLWVYTKWATFHFDRYFGR